MWLCDCYIVLVLLVGWFDCIVLCEGDVVVEGDIVVMLMFVLLLLLDECSLCELCVCVEVVQVNVQWVMVCVEGVKVVVLQVVNEVCCSEELVVQGFVVFIKFEIDCFVLQVVQKDQDVVFVECYVVVYDVDQVCVVLSVVQCEGNGLVFVL